LHRTWGATAEEATAPLPGDELVPDFKFRSTRAITIEAAPEAVWPWLMQLGMGRGGWYSYDNWAALLSSVPTTSTTQVIEELQGLKEGDLVDLIDMIIFKVHTIDAPNALVLYADQDMVPHQPWTKSWAFVLKPLPGGATRLLVRELSTWPNRQVGLITAVSGWAWFWATRRQLKNLKSLVEAQS
jgi:hypothetical protein